MSDGFRPMRGRYRRNKRLHAGNRETRLRQDQAGAQHILGAAEMLGHPGAQPGAGGG